MILTLNKKINIITRIKKNINNSKYIFVANYNGLNATQMTFLRKSAINLKCITSKVLSKNLCEKIFSNSNHKCLLGILKGAIIIFYSEKNQKLISSFLYNYSLKYNKLNIIGISLQGNLVSNTDIKLLSEIPDIKTIIINLILLINYIIIKFIFVTKTPCYDIINIIDYLKK